MEWWINGKLTDMTTKQAVIKLIDLKAFVERYGNPHDKWGDAINIGIEAIERIDAAIESGSKYQQMRPRKGHWKLVQRGKAIDVCCSNCEAVRIKGYAYNYTIDELNKEDINECFGSAEMRYCPNCGADMREVEE